MRYHDETIGRDAPQNWEARAGRSPAKWERFTRSDGLERWTIEHDAALERDIANTTRRIQSLDQELRPVARGALGKNPSPAWRTILGALVVAAWDSARRMGGQQSACVARVGERRRAPFSSLTAALEFAVYRQPLIGMAPHAGTLVQDRAKDVAARMSARAAGVDMRQPRTSRVGNREPRGLAAVELRVDVLRAIRHSRVGALDFWLLVATEVGELLPRARRTKSGAVEAALARRTVHYLAARVAEAGVELKAADVQERVDAARERLQKKLEARELLAVPSARIVPTFAPPLLTLRSTEKRPA